MLRFLRLPFNYLILLLVLLSSISSQTALADAPPYNSYYEWPDCPDCVGITLYAVAGQGYLSDCSNLPKRRGVSAVKAIVRSEKLQDFIQSKLPVVAAVANGRDGWVVDGTDAAVEGTWIIPSTGEILYQGGSVYPYAFLKWSIGEPNGGSLGVPVDEDMIAYLLNAITSVYRTIDVGVATLTTSSSGVVCMYQYPAVGSLTVTAANGNESIKLVPGTELVRYQLFPEHLAQLAAFRKCESIVVEDPLTGDKVRGYLAVFYTRHEYEIALDLIQYKSDVRHHSALTDFGAWIGANSTLTSTSTVWQQQGTATTESLSIWNSLVNATPAQAFTDFGGDTPAVNSGVAVGVNDAQRWKMVWTTLTATMPFMCSWRFVVNVTLSATGAYGRTFSSTFSSSIKKFGTADLLVVRLHQQWATTEEAEDHCWSSRLTNQAGDTVRGHLAFFFKTEEWTAVRKLTVASQLMTAGNGIGNNDALHGHMMGMTSPSTLTWGGDLSRLKSDLKWNRRIGKISVDGDGNIDSTFPWSLNPYAGDGSCKDALVCRTLVKTDDDNAVTITYRSDTDQVTTLKSGRRRPYLCAYRFPIRQLVHPTLVAEYHSYPMRYGEAAEYCALRQIMAGAGGTVKLNGTIFAELVREGAPVLKLVQDFASFGTHASGPVWLGDRRGSTCLVRHRFNKINSWVSCASPTYQFFCYFKLVSTRTQSATDWTAQRGTLSNTSTITSAPTETVSISPALTPSIITQSKKSASPSSLDTLSVSSSLSQSVSATPAPSASLSGSHHSRSSSQTDPTSLLTNSTPASLSNERSVSVTLSDPASSSSRSQERTATDFGTDSASDPVSSPSRSTLSLSEATATNTIHIVHKYEKPQEIKNLQQVTGLATLLSSGGTVAVTQARLEAADGLSRCGQNSVVEDDKPDFMASPMGWAIGDRPTSYAKGAGVGNVVAACIGAAILFFCAVIFGLLFKQSWRRGVELARIPGLLCIPFFILVPSSAEVAGVLLFNDPSPAGRLIAVGSACVMIGITLAVVVQLGRLVSSGMLAMRTLPPAPSTRIARFLQGRHWGRKLTRLISYLFAAQVGWTPFVDITEYLDVVSGKEDPNKRTLSEQASSFCISWGAVFEDFKLPYLPALDVGCSIILGFCAGVAQTPNLSRPECIATLSVALVAAFAHFFAFVYYKPCLVRATQWFMSIGSGLTLASVCLSFAFYMGQSFAYNSVVEKVMISQAVMGVFLMLVGVGFTLMVFVDFVDAFLAGRGLQHLDQVMKEQIDRYRQDQAAGGILTTHLAHKNASNKSNNKNKNNNSQSLEAEFALLVEQMKPREDEFDDQRTRERKSRLKNLMAAPDNHDDSVTAVYVGGNDGVEHEEHEMEEMLLPPHLKQQQQRRRDNLQRTASFSGHGDYLFDSSSDGDDADEEHSIPISHRRQRSRLDDEADSFFATPKNGHPKSAATYTSPRRRKSRAHDIVHARAMIQSVVDRQAKFGKQDEADNSSSASVPRSTSSKNNNLVPHFYNPSVTSIQAQKLQSILRRADAEKKKKEQRGDEQIIDDDDDDDDDDNNHRKNLREVEDILGKL